MRLTDRVEKIKRSPDLGKDVFVAILIVLVSVASFSLGRLSVLDGENGRGIRVISSQAYHATSSMAERDFPFDVAETESSGAIDGAYVGSKSGSTYHLPWCSGAARIKEENKIWFASKEEAARLGYRPAGNCKGI